MVKFVYHELIFGVGDYATYGNIAFGDTDGSLSGVQAGRNQILTDDMHVPPAVPPNEDFLLGIVGDARDMLGHAHGGNDRINFFQVNDFAVGDAMSMGEDSQGGDDVIRFFGNSDSVQNSGAYGDAMTMTGHARGGADDIYTFNGGFMGAPGYGDAYDMSGDSQGGDDRLAGQSDHHSGLVLYGDAYTMRERAVGGQDTLTGAEFAGSWLYGDAYDLTDDARGGNDHLIGGVFGGAQMWGDGFQLSGSAVGGNDTIAGGSSDFSHTQPAGTDMYGDGQILSDHATAGDDVLISGQFADDRMWGDGDVVGPNVVRGHNQFVFGPSNGQDSIMDFNPGHDRIVLQGVGPGSFAALAPNIHQVPGGVEVMLFIGDYPAGIDSIFVKGVSQLTAADFLFDFNGRNVGGGSRDDVLTAGGGNNSFYGGGGSDTFVIQAQALANSVGGTTHGIKGADAVIMDFSGAGGTPAGDNDMLWLSGFGAGSTLAFDHYGGGDPTVQFYTVHDAASGADYHLYIHSLDGQQLTASDYGFV